MSDWTRDNANYFRAIRIEKTMMSLILLLIVAVAAFNIVAMLVMVVTDKRTDIAILRTLGASPRRVMAIFLVQGSVIAWFGVALGVLLGTLIGYYAGDVAHFDNPLFGESMRVEHWTHAVEQAEHAAHTLLGDARPFAPAPMFWSDQYGIKIQFAGRVRPDDAIHVCHGSLEEKRFVALYGRAGRLTGVLAFRRPAQLVRYRRLIEARTPFAEAVASAG